MLPTIVTSGPADTPYGRPEVSSVADGAANVGLATYALTMPLREARAKVEAESAARAAKRAASQAARS